MNDFQKQILEHRACGDAGICEDELSVSESLRIERDRLRIKNNIALEELRKLDAANLALQAQLAEKAQQVESLRADRNQWKEAAQSYENRDNPFNCDHTIRFIWRDAKGQTACAACRMFAAERLERERDEARAALAACKDKLDDIINCMGGDECSGWDAPEDVWELAQKGRTIAQRVLGKEAEACILNCMKKS